MHLTHPEHLPISMAEVCAAQMDAVCTGHEVQSASQTAMFLQLALTTQTLGGVGHHVQREQ